MGVLLQRLGARPPSNKGHGTQRRAITVLRCKNLRCRSCVVDSVVDFPGMSFISHNRGKLFIVVVKFAMNWIAAHSHVHRFLRVSHVGEIHGMWRFILLKTRWKPKVFATTDSNRHRSRRKKIIDPEHSELRW